MSTPSSLPNKDEEITPGADAAQSSQVVEPPPTKRPFVMTSRTGGAGGKDKTVMMAAAAVAAVVLVVLFFCLISTKGSPKKKTVAEQSGKPSLGRVAQTNTPGQIVPADKLAVQQATETKVGSLDAHDIEKTKNPVVGGVSTESGKKKAAGSKAKTLGDLGQFQQPDTDPEHLKNWTPEPYSGAAQSAGGQQRQETEEYAKPSMVFVAHASNGSSTGSSQFRSSVTNFGLQSGYHVAARLESMASTALQAPVTAVIEYNYERDGKVLIPAGARAVGKISQADASGIMNIAFDSIELPDGDSVSISAIGATTSLQALKGQVTGKNTGRSFAVRALAGLGQAGAMLVGQSNVNGSLSESDLIRQRAAENIGSGADSQVMSMMLTQHIVVSVPAGTEIYIIFTKPQKAIQTTQASQTAASSIPTLATASNQ